MRFQLISYRARPNCHSDERQRTDRIAHQMQKFITATLASVFTNRPVRKDVAMTGEITLRGKVLPIGGIRDKVLATRRAGAKTVILPEANRKDAREIPDTTRKDLRLIVASHMDQVLKTALLKRPRKQAIQNAQ